MTDAERVQRLLFLYQGVVSMLATRFSSLLDSETRGLFFLRSTLQEYTTPESLSDIIHQLGGLLNGSVGYYCPIFSFTLGQHDCLQLVVTNPNAQGVQAAVVGTLDLVEIVPGCGMLKLHSSTIIVPSVVPKIVTKSKPVVPVSKIVTHKALSYHMVKLFLGPSFKRLDPEALMKLQSQLAPFETMEAKHLNNYQFDLEIAKTNVKVQVYSVPR